MKRLRGMYNGCGHFAMIEVRRDREFNGNGKNEYERKEQASERLADSDYMQENELLCAKNI